MYQRVFFLVCLVGPGFLPGLEGFDCFLVPLVSLVLAVS